MAGTGAGRKVYISDAAIADADLNAAGFAALTWVEIGKVGRVEGGGIQPNFPTYSLLAATVSDKQKGQSDTIDLTIELRPAISDLGQTALAAAALTRKTYGFKVMEDDAASASFTNSITYNRGPVGGPAEGLGGANDFRTRTYTVGPQQAPILVPSTAI